MQTTDGAFTEPPGLQKTSEVVVEGHAVNIVQKTTCRGHRGTTKTRPRGTGEAEAGVSSFQRLPERESSLNFVHDGKTNSAERVSYPCSRLCEDADDEDDEPNKGKTSHSQNKIMVRRSSCRFDSQDSSDEKDKEKRWRVSRWRLRRCKQPKKHVNSDKELRKTYVSLDQKATVPQVWSSLSVNGGNRTPTNAVHVNLARKETCVSSLCVAASVNANNDNENSSARAFTQHDYTHNAKPVSSHEENTRKEKKQIHHRYRLVNKQTKHPRHTEDSIRSSFHRVNYSEFEQTSKVCNSHCGRENNEHELRQNTECCANLEEGNRTTMRGKAVVVNVNDWKISNACQVIDSQAHVQSAYNADRRRNDLMVSPLRCSIVNVNNRHSMDKSACIYENPVTEIHSTIDELPVAAHSVTILDRTSGGMSRCQTHSQTLVNNVPSEGNKPLPSISNVRLSSGLGVFCVNSVKAKLLNHVNENIFNKACKLRESSREHQGLKSIPRFRTSDHARSNYPMWTRAHLRRPIGTPAPHDSSNNSSPKLTVSSLQNLHTNHRYNGFREKSKKKWQDFIKHSRSKNAHEPVFCEAEHGFRTAVYQPASKQREITKIKHSLTREQNRQLSETPETCASYDGVVLPPLCDKRAKLYGIGSLTSNASASKKAQDSKGETELSILSKQIPLTSTTVLKEKSTRRIAYGCQLQTSKRQINEKTKAKREGKTSSDVQVDQQAIQQTYKCWPRMSKAADIKNQCNACPTMDHMYRTKSCKPITVETEPSASANQASREYMTALSKDWTDAKTCVQLQALHHAFQPGSSTQARETPSLRDNVVASHITGLDTITTLDRQRGAIDLSDALESTFTREPHTTEQTHLEHCRETNQSDGLLKSCQYPGVYLVDITNGQRRVKSQDGPVVPHAFKSTQQRARNSTDSDTSCKSHEQHAYQIYKYKNNTFTDHPDVSKNFDDFHRCCMPDYGHMHSIERSSSLQCLVESGQISILKEENSCASNSNQSGLCDHPDDKKTATVQQTLYTSVQHCSPRVTGETYLCSYPTVQPQDPYNLECSYIKKKNICHEADGTDLDDFLNSYKQFLIRTRSATEVKHSRNTNSLPQCHSQCAVNRKLDAEELLCHRQPHKSVSDEAIRCIAIVNEPFTFDLTGSDEKYEDHIVE